MSGRIRRSIAEIRAFQAAKYEDKIVESALSALTLEKRLKFQLIENSRTSSDGLGMKLLHLFELVPGFPVLLRAKKFDNIQAKCPMHKVLRILPSLVPAKELAKLSKSYTGKRKNPSFGVVFPWPHFCDLVLHTMPLDLDRDGIQLVHRESADRWLVLEPYTGLLERLASQRHQWQDTGNAKEKTAGKTNSLPVTKTRKCQ